MAWLGIGAIASAIALQKLLGGDTPPNKVQEIKTESLGLQQILHRDEALLLYAPIINANDKKYYEIILQRPVTDNYSTSFSLYRASSLQDAEKYFEAFQHRVPFFVQIAKEFYNAQGLQKICDALIENPSWSLAHLIAFFNLTEYVNHPRVKEFLNYPDHKEYMTPLQLAIRYGNIDVVKAFLPLCDTEHLDINSNSVYHFAAKTNKEMINLLVSKTTKNLNHCNTEGFTPLHIACLSDKPECVNSLLLAGADVNRSASKVCNIYKQSTPSSVAEFIKQNPDKLYRQDMKYGGTPLHWCSSRETLQALIDQGCDINAQNFDGRTALHIMVARNRLECIVTLLSHEAEIDIKDNEGNTPLHIAIEKKFVPIVQCLVVFGCDINKENKDGFTPRHMVGKESSKGKQAEILYILHSVGAKRCPASNKQCPNGCNATGNYCGIPPESPESPEQREEIQEMLASTSRSFNSNFLGNNRNGTSKEFSPKTHFIDTTSEQKGQSVMDTILGVFTGKVKAISKEESIEKIGDAACMNESKSSENTQKRGRLLCLDGGGIRGLVLVQMLLEIEKISQTPISHMFDWIAGTSTGGILALALGCGKTMRQCMGLYLRLKEQCFIGSRPYKSDLFESILKENLGEFTVMSQIQHPKIMVTGVMADRKPVDLHLFRNYTSASDILDIVTPTTNRRVPPEKPEYQLIWKAARATGAAPSYFRSFGRFLDGGLIANNPTLDAMTEIHEYNMALRSVDRGSEVSELSAVVSLGTGLIPVTELKDIDVFRPESLWDTAKLAYSLSTLGNLLVDQATAADGRVVDRARAWCSTIGIPYFRFNPQLSEDIPMDEKNDLKLINMLWETKAYMYSNRNKIIEMINRLK